MLAPTQSDRKVMTNFSGAEFAMSIHEDAAELVMESLAGLYTDQHTAMLREYATNAIDAHKMAGNTGPIEVTLPKQMMPTLTIRDYGIGLDEADLREIYSQYGASTKRHSNDFNGMLGFGCKSALAYTDVFNITSVKDGVKTYCSVSRDEGIPKFRVLGTEATTDPNGTAVEIPVGERGDQRLLAEKAKVLYSYFDKGSVLVDGQPVKPFEFDSQIDDHTWVTKRGQHEYGDQPSYIVMGNVPYPAPINHGLAEGYAVVVKVPIGAVEFAPSREGLKLHKQSTKNTIASIEARLRKHFQTIVQREVDAAQTPLDALGVLAKWRAALRFDPNPDARPLRYRGRAIPNQISAGPMPKQRPDGGYEGPVPQFIMATHSARRLNAHSKVRAIDAQSLRDCVWIKNFTQAGFTVTTKKKMIEWSDQRYATNGTPSPKVWVLSTGEPPEFWTDNNVVLDWETDVKPIKLATANVAASGYGMSRPTGSYEGWVDGAYGHVLAADIDTSKPLYWYWGNRSEAGRFSGILEKANPNGYTFVHMPGNRTEKFNRDFPNAIGAQIGCDQAYAAWAKSLSLDVRKALYMNDMHMGDDFKALARFAGTIDDPEVRECVRISKVDISTQLDYRRRFRYVVELHEVGVTFDNPMDRYPLVAGCVRDYSRTPDHVRLYLNTAYRAYKTGVLK